MDRFNKPIFKIIIFILIVVVMSFVAKSLLDNDSEYIVDANTKGSETKMQSKKVSVDIKGEVNNPGVYTIDSSCRVKDAIKYAGGYSKDADVQKLNHAMRVYDGMEIIVPKKDVESKYDVFNDVMETDLYDK